MPNAVAALLALLVPVLAGAAAAPPVPAPPAQASACEAGDQRACVALASTPGASMEVRLAAVRRITDQRLLADLARTSASGDIRLEAIRNLIDQDALADIARHARSPVDRGRAAERLRDQETLAAIARSDASKWTRQRAARAITDERVIAQLVAENRKELLPTLVAGSGITRLTVDGREVKESLLGVTSILPGRHTISADYVIKDNVTWEDGSVRSAELDARLGATYVVEAELGIVTWQYLSPGTRHGRGTWKLVVREAVSPGPNLLPQLLR
jgi:hypothetical protein